MKTNGIKNVMIVSLLVIIALQNATQAQAATKSRLTKTIVQTIKITLTWNGNTHYGIDAPLEDFKYFKRHPRQLKSGHAVIRALKVMRSWIRLDNTSDMWEDGSFIIQGCIRIPGNTCK